MDCTTSSLSEKNTAAEAVVIVLCGVSGTGKSTGLFLASHFQSPDHEYATNLDVVTFIEGDDLHPASNKALMSRGIPLNDETRQPWLHAINEAVKKTLSQQTAASTTTTNTTRAILILTCSALKRSYRDVLRDAVKRPCSPCHSQHDRAIVPGSRQAIVFVWLKGSKTMLSERLKRRESQHFMKANMLESQLRDAETPSEDELQGGSLHDTIIVDVDGGESKHIVQRVCEEIAHRFMQ